MQLRDAYSPHSARCIPDRIIPSLLEGLLGAQELIPLRLLETNQVSSHFDAFPSFTFFVLFLSIMIGTSGENALHNCDQSQRE